MNTKFKISVQGENGSFMTIGLAKPSLSGKAWQLTLFADKLDLLKKSECGKFLNAIMVENKFPDKAKGF